MELKRVTDWTLLTGASVEIRQQGTPVCSGHVDAVTDNGKILWLQPPAQNRRLFEKAEFYEAWATEEPYWLRLRSRERPKQLKGGAVVQRLQPYLPCGA